MYTKKYSDVYRLTIHRKKKNTLQPYIPMFKYLISTPYTSMTPCQGMYKKSALFFV